MRKRIIYFGAFLVFLTLIMVVSSVPTVSAQVLSTSLKGPFDLSGKVKRLDPPGDKSNPTKGPPLSLEIVYPSDGASLSQGTYTILISAAAKAGVVKVELNIDGPESRGWTDITGNFDGTHYSFEWDVGTDGTYTLSAQVTDNQGRTKTDRNTIYIGILQPAQKWAVVIGIANYEGRDSDLWHPDEDAKEMKIELVESGYPDDNIILLVNRKATAQAIVDAIDWLIANEEANDEVVFFYSGHGYRAPDSEGWDIDVESDGYDEMIVTYDFYGLPDGWFKQKFSAIESTAFALMFGSCHSGGMFDDNDDLQGTGRVIAAACKADQYGWDYLLLGNTLWGYYFIDEGLLDNKAYSVETAHTYAYPHIVAEQPDSEPQLYDNFPGDFQL